MNILVVNWQDRSNPLSGGAEVHFHEIFSRIVRRGHSVTLCCSTYPGAAPRETMDGISVIRTGRRELFNFVFPLVYATRLRGGGYDVVVEDLNKLPFFSPLFVRRPVAGIAHHLFGRSVFRETWILPASYVYLMERAALALYRKSVPFMVVSRSTQMEFLERGFDPGRLEVIHNCVDHDLYTPGTGGKNAAPLAVYFGRLKKYKSVDTFLRALPPVIARFPALKAVVAGEGDDTGRLTALAGELGLAGGVEFTGYITETRKVDLLRRAWFTVTTSMKEGWGLTVVESNACGTPSIAADVPGLRDAVREGETGLLYPYGDSPALARGMIRLIEDGDLRRRLGEGAIRWAATFNWDDAAEKTIAFLGRLTASH
ncbi:MAG TPA: glycosyltransferase family 4 protein [Bacteroidota bacterium]|nr:glycosyltransferase family 4 protein [Bacteroidota bacterium]